MPASGISKSKGLRRQRGFRTRVVVMVTALLNPEQTTKKDLATLYRARWNNELDLRSIKSTMQTHDLRCKTPVLVRKEIWTHAPPSYPLTNAEKAVGCASAMIALNANGARWAS